MAECNVSLTSCQLPFRSLPIELDVATDLAYFFRIVTEGWLALFNRLFVHFYKVTINIYAHTLTILHRAVATAGFQDTLTSLPLAVVPLRYVHVSVPYVGTCNLSLQSSCTSLSLGGWKSV